MLTYECLELRTSPVRMIIATLLYLLWQVVSMTPLAMFVVHVTTGHGEANITLLPIESGARSLDGSPYGFYFIRSPSRNSTRWTVSIEGELDRIVL